MLRLPTPFWKIVLNYLCMGLDGVTDIITRPVVADLQVQSPAQFPPGDPAAATRPQAEKMRDEVQTGGHTFDFPVNHMIVV